MILIIHGNDLTSSRNFYFGEKNKLGESILLEGEGLTYETIFQNAENTSLFEDKKTILIENFFHKNKANTIEFKKIVDYINSNKNLQIIFWEPVELSKTAQNAFTNAVVKTFSYPQVLFAFLDALKPGDYQRIIKMFHGLEQNMEPELIFFMLNRQFRLMLNVLDSQEKIDELKRMAPWQLSKLDKQAHSFGEEKLKKLYKQLFEIDLNSKTGKIPYALERSIDFFLADL